MPTWVSVDTTGEGDADTIIDLEKVVSMEVSGDDESAVLHFVGGIDIVSEHPTWAEWKLKLAEIARGE